MINDLTIKTLITSDDHDGSLYQAINNNLEPFNLMYVLSSS